ncbi:hypothetical protein [Dawidia soli]|uniref:Uncharacterized protein n=1 Tax=Dawidia soli TaxID=2782352 RepID=A0AAP2DD95_9BACT|nr:hypothetical protein [Dawidia soli]MBT1689222.1 hypothetical protein [Dawidia soli]
MNLRHVTLLFVLLAGSTDVFAQPQKVTVTCGKKISLEFTSRNEVHEIKIRMDAGDKLQFKVTPTGDYLNVRAEITDPAGGHIYPTGDGFNEPMFEEKLRFLEVTTGQLSARGEYTIKLFNCPSLYPSYSKAGEYSFVATCFKKDGTVVGN